MNIAEIKEDTYFLSNTFSASYPSAALLRNINIAYNEASRIIWENAAGWDFDDSNATDQPIAVATLVHNQQDYALPTTANRIKRVEVEDSEGNWWQLTPIDQSQIIGALPEHREGASVPQEYDIIGGSLYLYPAPTSGYCTLTSGIQVYIDRNVTEFTSSDTTTSPGIALPFHRYLSVCAALDITEDLSKKQWLLEMKDRIEKGLASFYSRRDVEMPMRITPKAKRFWQQYL